MGSFGFLWVLLSFFKKKVPIRTYQNLSEPIPPELIKEIREIREVRDSLSH